MTPKRKAVFLDRDGTIIEEANYLADPDGVRLLDGAAKGIQMLKEAGYFIVVTTNQSGVARGYFSEETLRQVNERMRVHLREEGTDIDALYYCPHYEQGSLEEFALACECRKPLPGMIHQASREHELDLYQSWVIGDKTADIEFGRAVDCRTVLVLTGYGQQTKAQGFAQDRRPTLVVKNLSAAAVTILASGERR